MNDAPSPPPEPEPVAAPAPTAAPARANLLSLRRCAASGMALGTAFFALLFTAGTISLARLQASPDPDTARVLEHFPVKVYLTLARIGLVHLWAGLILGGACAFVAALCYPALRRRRWALLAMTLALILGVFGWCSIRLIVRQPTFYDRFLFAQGEYSRGAMFWLTDHVGLRAIDLTAAILLAAFVLCSHEFRRCVPSGVPRGRGQRAFVLVALTTLLSVLWMNLWKPQNPGVPARPNVLILAVDSLRPDHLSALGCARPTTPNIDRLAAESTVFDNAFVPFARTLPSWTTFLTGTYSHTHGVRHMFPRPEQRRPPMPTLPEVLRRDGYKSAVVSDFAGEMFHLVDYGFDLVDAPPASDIDVLVQRQMLLHFAPLFPFVNHWLGKRLLPVIAYFTVNSDARTLGRRALRRMRELSDPGPFFLTVFFSTAHAPYASPYPFYRKFTDPDYRGQNRYAHGVRDPRDLREAAPVYSQADRDQIVALYDGAVAHCDGAIGEILDQLREWGLMDSTIVVITADHGEHLFEYGNTLDHGKWFRGGDCANRIPWILYDPSRRLPRGRVPFLVRSLDVMPTLLSMLGSSVPDTCEGVDLTPFLKEGSATPQLTLFGETGVQMQSPLTFAGEPDAFQLPHVNEMIGADPWDFTLILEPPFDELVIESKHRMLRTDRYKLVYEPRAKSCRFRLYDVIADPGNQDDLSAREPERFAEMREQLVRWIDLDPLRRLQSNGHFTR